MLNDERIIKNPLFEAKETGETITDQVGWW